MVLSGTMAWWTATDRETLGEGLSGPEHSVAVLPVVIALRYRKSQVVSESQHLDVEPVSKLHKLYTHMYRPIRQCP